MSTGSENSPHELSGLSVDEINEITKIQTYSRNQAKFKIIKVGNPRHLSVTAIRPYVQNDLVGCFTGMHIERRNIRNRQINKDTSLEIIVKENIQRVIDGGGDNNNWVKYISKARNIYEQNVDIVYQRDRFFAFLANRDILPGKEFLAWFSCQEWSDYFITPGNHFQQARYVSLNMQPQLTQWYEAQICYMESCRNSGIAYNSTPQNDQPASDFNE